MPSERNVQAVRGIGRHTRGALLLILWGCGSASTPTPVTISNAEVVAAPLTPEGDNKWTGRTWEQRHSDMTFSMLPMMGRRFRDRRGGPATLACITCHGRDAEERRYAMPATLPALDPNAIPQTEEARWMADVVVPLADRIMKAGGTTTCFTCHPSVESGT